MGMRRKIELGVFVVLGASCATTRTAELRQQEEKHPPEIRAMVLPDPFQALGLNFPGEDEADDEPEQWLLAPEGGLLTGDALQMEARREKQAVSLAFFGGEKGLWGTEVRLTLTFGDADPLRPNVEAQVSWYSDCGPASGKFEKLSGMVNVAYDAKESGEVGKKRWIGDKRATISFTLHGTAQGKPHCVHGKFKYAPE